MSDLTGKNIEEERKKRRENDVNVRKFHPLFNNNNLYLRVSMTRGILDKMSLLDTLTSDMYMSPFC